MRNVNDLESTKEYELAMTIEDSINAMSFKEEVFAQAVLRMHPTLQQKFFRIMRETMKAMADKNHHIDDRNRASHEEARLYTDFLKKHGRAIPVI
ncbi:hypothetical protein [Parabacteroides merdae]|jgi:hypothetical protein|uniref:hypothetical protein n=1 Tax=Parabacteroides merdae TaxID=46503 RepID=UPI0034A22BE6